MEIALETRPNGVAIVRPSGRLDLLTAVAIKERLNRAVEDGYGRVVVDLASVTFVDSSGLGALIGGLKAARLAGGDLRLARAGEQVRAILDLTTLNRVLPPFQSVEEAMAGF